MLLHRTHSDTEPRNCRACPAYLHSHTRAQVSCSGHQMRLRAAATTSSCTKEAALASPPRSPISCSRRCLRSSGRHRSGMHIARQPTTIPTPLISFHLKQESPIVYFHSIFIIFIFCFCFNFCFRLFFVFSLFSFDSDVHFRVFGFDFWCFTRSRCAMILQRRARGGGSGAFNRAGRRLLAEAIGRRHSGEASLRYRFFSRYFSIDHDSVRMGGSFPH
eukprot:COSAG05_NODE_354_length_10862_cov_59.954659_6_plen_218_part_00